MRNKIITIALIIILPLFVTACTLQDLPLIGPLFGVKTPNLLNKPVSLTIWGLWESPEVVNEAISKYKELHPNVTINYEDRSVVKSDKYKETIFNRVTQSDGPDIVLTHNSWVGDLKANLSPMPNSLMSVDEYNQVYYPVAANAGVIDGKIYAVPMYYDGLVLVYNKKHFDEIDQNTPPTAWEEFRRLALSLTVRGENNKLIRSGAAIGTARNIEFGSDIFGLMLEQAGVAIPEDLSSKSAKDALSFYSLFYSEDGVWDPTFPEASTAFAQEKVSMIFVPSWQLLDIIKARPDLDIGVAPIPQAIPERPVSWGSFWMYSVSANSANKEVAWDFIKFMTEEEQQISLFSNASKYRTYGAPYSRVSLTPQLSSGSYSKYLKPLVDTAPYAHVNKFAARSGNTKIEEAFKDSIERLNAPKREDQLTPEQALIEIKKAFSTSN